MKGLALALPLLLALAGCTSPRAAEATNPPTVDLVMGDDFFQSLNDSVPQGTKIRFHNNGGSNHTVTVHLEWLPSDEMEFDQEVAPGGEASYRFEEEATYHVFCRFHGAIGSGMHVDVTTQE